MRWMQVLIYINVLFMLIYLLLISFWYMQAPQNLFFTPNPTTHYKIVSVLDQKKAFTVQ